MKTQPTFEKTVDVLVKAYLNDTLAHTTCWACAVGNLVAHGCGYKILKGEGFSWINPENGKRVMPDWFDVCMFGAPNLEYYTGLTKHQIDSTGYSPEEIAAIEHAFEIPKGTLTFDEWMFNGLIAVVDVLADIHGIDLEKKEAAKLLFAKA